MNLAKYIDHTILKSDCTIEEIKQYCEEAILHEFKAVCVPPYYVKDAARFLNESTVCVVTVIGFPMGYSATPAKVEEIKRAVNDGVDELDVMVNICAIKKGDWAYVKNDIDSATLAVHSKGKKIKLIFENSLLTKEEIQKLCIISEDKGVDFVKTCTGLNGKCVNIEDVKLLRNHLSSKIKIKASGDINSTATAIELIEAGADRIGCRTSVDIISQV